MLLFGYLGETGKMEYWIALLLGFLCYAALMYFLWEKYVKDSDEASKNVYYVFVTIWGLYGLAYLLKTRGKNIAYNVLDLISKAGFGVLIWLSMLTSNPTQNIKVVTA